MSARDSKRWKPSDLLKVGKTKLSLNDWASKLGCPVQTILGRLARGWDAARAVGEKISDVGGATRGKKLPAEVLTAEESKRILDACNEGATGARNRALIVVGWRSGLRISEVLDLMPHNIDFENQSVRVLHGKGDKARTTGIDAESLIYIAKWLEARAGLGIDDKAPLFCTLDGEPLQARYVRALMPRLARRAKVQKRCHFHGLRHTNAAELAAEGVPMNEIQQHLGHSSLAVTSKYLAHLNPEQTVNRLRSRGWGSQDAKGGEAPGGAPPRFANAAPPPGWVDSLRDMIGPRLSVFYDGRTSPEEFKAIVLLVD